MPVEIRELVIRATVVDRNNNPPQEEINLQKLKREIMQECLDKLRKKQERKNKR